MQVLKGNIYKSITVANLLKCTNSCYYVYYDYQLPFDSYYVNSKVANLNQLKEHLQEYIKYKNSERKLISS